MIKIAEKKVMQKMYWVFTFPTTHLAMKFEKVAKEEGREVKLIPLPRKIGASCGFCGKVKREEEIEKLIEMCERYSLEYENIYEIPGDKKKEPALYR